MIIRQSDLAGRRPPTGKLATNSMRIDWLKMIIHSHFQIIFGQHPLKKNPMVPCSNSLVTYRIDNPAFLSNCDQPHLSNDILTFLMLKLVYPFVIEDLKRSVGDLIRDVVTSQSPQTAVIGMKWASYPSVQQQGLRL